MPNRRFLIAVLCVALAVPGMAQIELSAESIGGLYKGKGYSPYAERSFPSDVSWGDTHLHTALSPDAGLFGNRPGVEEAYRFARGEQVTSSTGHSDMMGFATDPIAGAPAILESDQVRGWAEAMQKGGKEAEAAALDLITNFAQATLDPSLVEAYSPGSGAYDNVWADVIDTAERFNEPGHFTIFIGYEWTSLVRGNDLHRNVILRDNADRARQVVPMVTRAPYGSTDPLELYAWLEDYTARTGGQALAIAHDGNLSNGLVFPVDKQYTGKAIDRNYVELRNKWEPLYEITRIEADGDAHPLLSPEDAELVGQERAYTSPIWYRPER